MLSRIVLSAEEGKLIMHVVCLNGYKIMYEYHSQYVRLKRLSKSYLFEEISAVDCSS